MKLFTVIFALLISSSAFANNTNFPLQISGCSVNFLDDFSSEDASILVPKLMPYGIRVLVHSSRSTNVRIFFQNHLDFPDDMALIYVVAGEEYQRELMLPQIQVNVTAHARGLDNLIPYILTACSYAQQINVTN
jgi:hypothetical protein